SNPGQADAKLENFSNNSTMSFTKFWKGITFQISFPFNFFPFLFKNLVIFFRPSGGGFILSYI
ncbi:MAG: hypothetical protein C6I01_03805, partial [Epsilonproteobacteria bacterium]|nr:hypothetical protein [Campylobacterota bacterium]